MAERMEERNEIEATPLVYVRQIAGAEVLAEVGEDEIKAQGLVIGEADTLYAVHMEDGTRMAVFSDRGHAFAAARYHGAEPVSVH
ncbi:DUF1150 family protein [Marinicauda algicola]|uniref:DUF1150 family protein n=2 Tax=Marinicauda algicola TaxID=2029849 RepID=A0A4S2H0L5_9PROT|nr:DUF1150 family protein [Marinicauda algicola]